MKEVPIAILLAFLLLPLIASAQNPLSTTTQSNLEKLAVPTSDPNHIGTVTLPILSRGIAGTNNTTVLDWTYSGSAYLLTVEDLTWGTNAVQMSFTKPTGLNVLSVPDTAGTPDTFALIGAAQTFTNKTFTGGTFNSPTINTPNVVVASLNNHFYDNFATAGQTPAAATRTYITGSGITITAGQIQVGTHIHWRFDMTKTAAGSATSTFDIAFGTAGTTSDTARVSFTKPAGTAAGDEGWVDIDCVVKTNSSSGVVIGEFTMIHNLASTGHMVIPSACVSTTSSTFDTTLPTNIGICITSGASDAITINQVFASADNL